jgi:hypothetical protein
LSRVVDCPQEDVNSSKAVLRTDLIDPDPLSDNEAPPTEVRHRLKVDLPRQDSCSHLLDGIVNIRPIGTQRREVATQRSIDRRPSLL